jgi:hypothetical protein
MRSIVWSCRGLIATGLCMLEGGYYQQYNMIPGMEDGQAQYTVTRIAPSVPHGIADMPFHDQQTETWPSHFSPTASLFSPTLSGQLTSPSHPNLKVPIPRLLNNHPSEQKSAFILTPLQSTYTFYQYTRRARKSAGTRVSRHPLVGHCNVKYGSHFCIFSRTAVE